MSIFATVVSALLGLVFLVAGVPKILRIAYFRERVRHWRLPARMLPVIGLVELGGAGLLLVGAVTQGKPWALAGAALVAATMAGAIVTHMRVADPPAEALHAAGLGALAMLDVVLLAG
jgi:putative oxidoreductase